MATFLKQWEQVAQYDPTNPNQIVHARYAGLPGGYASYYYNQVPLTSQLLGVSPSTWPAWAQALGVGVFGLALGFAGMKYGRPFIKKRLGR